MHRSPYILAPALALVTLLLYLPTLAPTINFLDSGELVTVAWTVGIAHPPGYPLYTLLTSAWIRLPFGDPAWRMNLFSAVCAAIAVGLLYAWTFDTLTARLPVPTVGKDRQPATRRRSAPAAAKAPAVAAAGPPTPVLDAVAAAITAAGLLACSLTFWNWATQAKMYTLHFAFMAGLLMLALRVRRALLVEQGTKAVLGPRFALRRWSPGVRLLHGLALLAGFSMTNHSLSNLLWPGIAILLLAPAAGLRSPWRRLLHHAPTLLLAGLLPLLVFLYLPLRSAGVPLMNWGSPSTWGDFWRHISGWQFIGAYVGKDAANLGDYIGYAGIFAANQVGLPLTLLLLPLIAMGVVYLWRTDPAVAVASLFTALLDIGFTLNYQIREVVVYYVPFYMLAAWWAGLGLGWGIGLARAHLPAASRLLAPPAARLALGALLPLLALLSNWGVAGQRDDLLAERFVRNAYASFEPNAVVLTTSWDLASGSYYLQYVRGERRDVAMIDKSLLRYPFYVEYIERTYPDLVSRIPEYAEFKALDRHWVNVGNNGLTDAESARLNSLYFTVLRGFISPNLGRRPVYAVFPELGKEEQDVLQPYLERLVPSGLGLRVAAGPSDHASGDPGFDLRGLLSEHISLDEVDYSVIWIYPVALQNIANYLVRSNSSAEARQEADRLLALAQQLQPFATNPSSRPSLR